MELLINQEKRHIDFDAVTIKQLLDIEVPQKQKGIAVAVNTTVIPKSDWNSYHLNPNDEVLIISATQGG